MSYATMNDYGDIRSRIPFKGILKLMALLFVGYVTYCLIFPGFHWAYTRDGMDRLEPAIALSLTNSAERHAAECTDWYNAPFILKRTWYRKQGWCTAVRPSIIPGANYNREEAYRRMFAGQQYMNENNLTLCEGWFGQTTYCDADTMRPEWFGLRGIDYAVD